MSIASAHESASLTANRPAERRLSDLVYGRVLEMIIGGQLPPGQPISELQLTRLLEVSRTPVHEAINRLVKDELVIQQPNRRPVIAAFSAEDVFDVFEVRRILEGATAKKAAEKMDTSVLHELEQLTKAFESDVQEMPPDSRQWIERWADYDELFHRLIAKACGSKRLASDVLRYRLFHRAFNLKHCGTAVLEKAHQEHLNILDAIRNRDPVRATDEMQSHISHFQVYFTENQLNPACDPDVTNL